MATLFRENGIDYDKVNYFSEPLTDSKLRELARKTGLTPFEMLRAKEAKMAGIEPDTPPSDVFKKIVEDPNLLQRPIVEVGDKAVMARPIENALELIEAAAQK